MNLHVKRLQVGRPEIARPVKGGGGEGDRLLGRQHVPPVRRRRQADVGQRRWHHLKGEPVWDRSRAAQRTTRRPNRVAHHLNRSDVVHAGLRAKHTSSPIRVLRIDTLTRDAHRHGTHSTTHTHAHGTRTDTARTAQHTHTHTHTHM